MSQIIHRAAELLRQEAQALEACHTRGDGDWTGEAEAKATATEMIDVADELINKEDERALAIIRANPDFKLLERFQPIERYSEDSADLRLGLVVDTETTGLDADASIIEIGMILFSYSPSAKTIHAIVDSYSGLEDPGFPIPANITAVTGITSEDVAGKVIDWEHVGQLAGQARFAIAHKADFDRPLMEKRCPAFIDIPWACSLTDIDWASLGMGSSKLDYIAFKLGFFFDGHRAENDCRALLHILTQTFPGAKASLFDMMTRAAAAPSYRVWAVGASFDVKDTLKANGYRWNDGADGRPKAWHKDVRDRALLQPEHDWLKNLAYPRFGDQPLTVPVETFTALTRHSVRRGDMQPMNLALGLGDPPAPAAVPVPVAPPSQPPVQAAPTPIAEVEPPAPKVLPVVEQGQLFGEAPAARSAAPRV